MPLTGVGFSIQLLLSMAHLSCLPSPSLTQAEGCSSKDASCPCLAKVSSSWSLGAPAEARQGKPEAVKMLRVQQPKWLCPQADLERNLRLGGLTVGGIQGEHPTPAPSPCHRLDDFSLNASVSQPHIQAAGCRSGCRKRGGKRKTRPPPRPTSTGVT